MKKHYQRYFEEIKPDKEQKNKIYECIIEKYDSQSKIKVEKSRNISLRSVFSAAAVTAGIGIAASLIVTNLPKQLKPDINTTSESENITTDQNSFLYDEIKDGDLTIKSVFSNNEKLAVIYTLYLRKEESDIITAEIKTSINSTLDDSQEKIKFKKYGNMYISEKVYDISDVKNKNTYKIRSELSQLITDKNISLEKKPEVSYTVSADDCTGIYKREKIKFLGNTEHLSGEYISDAFVEITPFETIVTLPGYEDYSIELSDWKGNVLKNIHDNVFEPMNTHTNLLGITAVSKTDRQYFSVSACGYRTSEYSGGIDLVSKNTVNALSVLDEYDGIYSFKNNKQYTEISEFYSANPEKLVGIGTQTYADSMFSSADGTDLSNKLNVSVTDSKFANIQSTKGINLDLHDKIEQTTKSFRETYPGRRFAVLSVTYNIENKSDENADFYFYGGHPIMKSFTECFDDTDIISDNVFYFQPKNSYPDRIFSLSAGETIQITSGYIIPAESISVGFYISANNGDNFVLMDTK